MVLRTPKAPIKEINAKGEQVPVTFGRSEVIRIAVVNNFDFGPKAKADILLTSKYCLLILSPQLMSAELYPAFPWCLLSQYRIQEV